MSEDDRDWGISEADIRWRPFAESPRQSSASTRQTRIVDETPRPRKAEDLVIEEFAWSEAAALERIGALEEENRVLRTMMREALTMLTRQTALCESARATILGLRKQSRKSVRGISGA